MAKKFYTKVADLDKIYNFEFKLFTFGVIYVSKYLPALILVASMRSKKATMTC
jgi:hypothetical protein